MKEKINKKTRAPKLGKNIKCPKCNSDSKRQIAKRVMFETPVDVEWEKDPSDLTEKSYREFQKAKKVKYRWQEKKLEYEYVTEEDKATIIDNQLKQLEANHFSISLVEPSKLKDLNEHMAWQQQIDVLENSITHLRREKIKLNNG